MLRSFLLVAQIALALALTVVGPPSASAAPAPCTTQGCDAGCFMLGPGSSTYNDCMARCQSGSTSDEMMIADPERAFLDEVRPVFSASSDQALLHNGNNVCKMLSQGASRDQVATSFGEYSGAGMESADFFVAAAYLHLCPSTGHG